MLATRLLIHRFDHLRLRLHHESTPASNRYKNQTLSLQDVSTISFFQTSFPCLQAYPKCLLYPLTSINRPLSPTVIPPQPEHLLNLVMMASAHELSTLGLSQILKPVPSSPPSLSLPHTSRTLLASTRFVLRCLVCSHQVADLPTSIRDMNILALETLTGMPWSPLSLPLREEPMVSPSPRVRQPPQR